MPEQFKTIGLLGKHTDARIRQTILELNQFLTQLGYHVILDQQTARLLPEINISATDKEMLGQHCDLLIAVGGDGTFLSAVRTIVAHEKPLVGINLGRLGFLVDISPSQMQDKLAQILDGQFLKESRNLLNVQIIRDDQVIHQELAVNEVVVHRWVTPSMIEIITHINGVYLNSQRSDGLIISTPTGSTAYSLSAGGPLLHPSLKALVLVPLNPHTLTNRPIVIQDDCEIEIRFLQTKQINALVTCDHLEIPEVLISDKILITQYPKPVTILHPQDHDFFDILRKKLNWSSGYPA